MCFFQPKFTNYVSLSWIVMVKSFLVCIVFNKVRNFLYLSVKTAILLRSEVD